MSLSGLVKVMKSAPGTARYLSASSQCCKKRFSLSADLILSYIKYGITPQQYADNELHLLNAAERKSRCSILGRENQQFKKWDSIYHANWRFLAKWTGINYSGRSYLSFLRSRAYKRHYNLSNTPTVQYGVKIICEHQMAGKLEIGKNVLLAKECFIDYTGDVIIKDNVRITNGVIIQTHHHPFHSDWQADHKPVQGHIIIEEDAVLGTRSIILPSCHYIGKHARVGAGSVVTHDVPDYAVVVGSPARVVREQEHE